MPKSNNSCEFFYYLCIATIHVTFSSTSEWQQYLRILHGTLMAIICVNFKVALIWQGLCEKFLKLSNGNSLCEISRAFKWQLFLWIFPKLRNGNKLCEIFICTQKQQFVWIFPMLRNGNKLCEIFTCTQMATIHVNLYKA